MGMTNNLCESCINLGCLFLQSGIVRTECAFYMSPRLEPDNCGNYIVQGSTTKNDLGVDCISREDGKIKVGDEVRYYHPVSKKMMFGVVTGVDSDYHYAFLMKKDGDFCTVIFASLVRTGRHFPQIKAVLNLLKENKNMIDEIREVMKDGNDDS